MQISLRKRESFAKSRLPVHWGPGTVCIKKRVETLVTLYSLLFCYVVVWHWYSFLLFNSFCCVFSFMVCWLVMRILFYGMLVGDGIPFYGMLVGDAHSLLWYVGW